MEQDELIATYFHLGLRQNEILSCLAHSYGIILSLRTLQRILQRQHLYRRKNVSCILDVFKFVRTQLNESGQLHGYRWMHLKCIQNNFVVSREVVRLLIKLLDPLGVEYRTRNRLRRRKYYSKGPDYMWHMDGYDKLKPYGICINGCIDGYSRFMIWLEAYTTNSDPRIISGYFMNAVNERKGCPSRIRSDMGTENTHTEQMQIFLRDGHDDRWSKEYSFFKGKSTTNQRIESWWCQLRKESAQYWINMFQGLKDRGHYTGEFLDKNLIQFCFLKVIQEELDRITNVWNSHHIRTTRNANVPGGKPIVLYTVPELWGAQSYLKDVTEAQVQICMSECLPKSPLPCDQTVFDLCCDIMATNGWDSPSTSSEAKHLYMALRLEIHELFDL